MRDLKRIDEVMKRLNVAWKLCPDLRLNQLMSSINKGEDSFYIEDDIMLERINTWINNIEKQKMKK